MITGLLAGYQVFAQSPYRLTADAAGVKQVIAFRVEFQPDTDGLTEGDGTFNSTVSDTGYLNAGPHDSLYFASQLRFLESWWEQQSAGRLDLQTYLYPAVFRLPQSMRYYSAVGQPADSGYARLIRDFIKAANTDAGIANLPVAPTTHFILFHAGLGRDINWTSILGGEPTPADIASIYLSRDRINTLTNGIPAIGPNLTLENLSILPEMLSRTTESFGQTILFNFGIAGLMIANMGNYLGLPDLYDTETGRSRAGRFALMDGYGFFNFNGFIPSPLSTWERYQLGWESPRFFNRSNLPGTIEISDADPSPVYVHLGSERYYLIERKYRYPAGGSRSVTVQSTGKGRDTSYTYSFDANGFYPYDQSDLKGVITSIDNPDWVIPAGYTVTNDTIDGGLLIWRLDDSKVREFAASSLVSGINNGDSPALSLMEADGSKDIGELFGDFTAGSGSETGTIFDYWYPGNIAPLYKNEFSENTTPSSNWSFKNPTGFSLKNLAKTGRNFSFSSSFEAEESGRISYSGKLKSYPVIAKSAFWMIDGTDTLQVVVAADSLRMFKNGVFIFSGETGDNAVVLPAGPAPELFLWVQQANGQLYTVHFSSGGNPVKTNVNIPGGNGTGFDKPERLINGWGFLRKSASGSVTPVFCNDDASVIQEFSEVTGDGIQVIWLNDGGNYVPCSFNPETGTLAPDKPGVVPVSGEFTEVFVSENHNTVVGIRKNGELFSADSDFDSIDDFESGEMSAGSSGSRLIRATDGWYRVSFSGRTVTAWENNLQLPGLPVWLPDSIETSGLVMIGNNPFVLVSTLSGVYSLPLTGGNDYQAESFNFGQSSLISGNGVLYSARVIGTSSVEYQVASMDGISFGASGSKPWKTGSYGTTSFSRRQVFAGANLKGDAYVWPNPSSEDRIQVRWLVPFSGSGTVTITDMTGDRVKEFKISSLANSEGELSWDCGQSQAGLYFARIQLSGDGKSFSELIKFILIR